MTYIIVIYSYYTLIYSVYKIIVRANLFVMKKIKREAEHPHKSPVFFDGHLLKKCHTITRRVFYFAATLLLFSAIVACDKDKEEYPLIGTDLSMADIAGTWDATTANFSSYELDDDGQPYFIDILAEGGSFTMVIQKNGRFTATITLPGEPDNISTGQLGFDEQWLAITFDDDPGEYEYYFIELVNEILTLRGPTEFDFNGDDLDEPASLELIMERS